MGIIAGMINKWTVGVVFLLILYFTGFFAVFEINPIIWVFVIIGGVAVLMGDKK